MTDKTKRQPEAPQEVKTISLQLPTRAGCKKFFVSLIVPLAVMASCWLCGLGSGLLWFPSS